MANTGKEYELLTKTVFEGLARLEGLRVIEITHNKKLVGLSSAEHQIDVYLKVELLGQEREFVIEAKDFENPVDKPRLMAFVGVLTDLKRVQGMFVTRSGFDKGNIMPVAEAHNVSLYVLDECDGPRTAFVVSLYEHSAQIKDLYLDKEANGALLDHLKSERAEAWMLYDQTGMLKTNLQLLMHQAFDLMDANNIPPGGCVTAKFDEPDHALYFHTGDRNEPRIRFLGAVFERCRRLQGEHAVDHKMTHLLQSLTNDKKYFVDQNGQVLQAGHNMPIPLHFESVGLDKQDVYFNVVTQVPDNSD